MATNGVTVPILTEAQKRQLAGPPISSPFSPDDRLYRSFDDYGRVQEWPDLDLRAMRAMLSEDGNPRKLEQVLTLPLRSADWTLTGGSPEAKAFVADTIEPLLDTLIDQCTSAVANRKAFFETTYSYDLRGVVLDGVLSRPAVACRSAWREDGSPDGFEQQLNPFVSFAGRDQRSSFGWKHIPANRAFIYRHGAYREPLHGVSDLDVSLRCWQNIKKLEFLWCQYLEQTSLPKTIVYGDDPGQAQANAQAVADANASAVIPMERRNDPTQKVFETLESSGRGADQFQKAILYFSSMQTQSVLASFTDLAQNASLSNAGSNALSADQSEFFLASRQAVANEMAGQITDGLIRPVCVWNFGPDVQIPRLRFAPIGNKQTDRALLLLNTIITSTKTVPFQFTGFLLNQVSTALGLDNAAVEDLVVRWGEAMQTEMEAAQAAQVAAASQPVPMANPSAQPQDAQAAKNAQLSTAIDVATELTQRVQAGADPTEALNAMKAPTRTPSRRDRRRAR